MGANCILSARVNNYNPTKLYPQTLRPSIILRFRALAPWGGGVGGGSCGGNLIDANK